MTSGAGPDDGQGVTHAIDIMLAEFNALRAEIGIRMTVQSALIGAGLAALGVIVGFAVGEKGDRRLLLAVPLVAVSVGILTAIENRQIKQIGRHITGLWTQLVKLGAATVMPADFEWWQTKQANIKPKVVRVVLDYSTTFLFAGASVAAVFVAWKDYSVDNALLIGAFVLTAVAIAAPVWLRERRLDGGALGPVLLAGAIVAIVVFTFFAILLRPRQVQGHASAEKLATLNLFALDEVVTSHEAFSFPLGGGDAETYHLTFTARFASPTTNKVDTVRLAPPQTVNTVLNAHRSVDVAVVNNAARAALEEGRPLLVTIQLRGSTRAATSSAKYSLCLVQRRRGPEESGGPLPKPASVSGIFPDGVDAPTCL